MSERLFNFSAGPGALPDEVVRQAQQDVWNIAGSGVGILEHSHRGKVVDRVFEEAEADCRRIGAIPDHFKILFLTGGASAQFHMVPMNFRPAGRTADYFDTGVWSSKALAEAKHLGAAHCCGSSEAGGYRSIPTGGEVRYSDRPAYVHYCSNNTIYGTRFEATPRVPEGVPLICDMSSEMFARPIDWSRLAMVYAGAQKNLGPAGVTLAVVREDLIERGPKDLPTMLQYRTFVKDISRVNTPPVFAVYVMGLVLKWLDRQGGLRGIEERNERKAKLIYDVIDGSKFYTGHAERACRSRMNITFTLPTEALTDEFVKDARKAGLDALKGYRTVGGIRASTYNAMPVAGCEALASFMREFERTKG